MDFRLFILPLIAFIIASLTSQAGVSGAFLLLPVQISLLGITSPVASATNLLYNIIAIPSAIYWFRKEKRFILPLVLPIVCGAIPGVFIGTFLHTTFLLNPRAFKLFVGIVLCLLGLRLFLSKGKRKIPVTNVRIKKISLFKVHFCFGKEFFSFSPVLIFFVVLVTSTISGAYGIGGGALLSPLLICVFGLPVYAIASATLTGTFVTSICGVLSYAHFGYPPSLKVAILLGIGGMLGMYTGARLQRHTPERAIKIILGFLIFIPAIRYILSYFINLN
ncbi:MAG: sulfite exporter TauE/SafE family protein [Candidatus Desulfofervidaceae bacterium]|nr:sulfite exporter TauE/SafE family protein [Candidatus Desulfofervidaceae bacterium]